MNEGPFSKHEVEFVIQPRPGLHDGRRVGETADGATHFGQISARHDCWWLVIDPDLHRMEEIRPVDMFVLETPGLSTTIYR